MQPLPPLLSLVQGLSLLESLGQERLGYFFPTARKGEGEGLPLLWPCRTEAGAMGGYYSFVHISFGACVRNGGSTALQSVVFLKLSLGPS